jgi:Uma2 family endonuclease
MTMHTSLESPFLSAHELPLRRFTVKEYHALGDAGVLGENDRVELLEGMLVMMSPIKPPHVYTVEETCQQLTCRLPNGTHVRMQHPITLSNSEPQPDLAVVRGDRLAYQKRHPKPKDILLLIEVSDTTLRADRYKAKVYAAAGIPTYWIINLVKREIEVYSMPSRVKGTKLVEYKMQETLAPSDEITVQIDQKTLRIPVRSVLPL